MTLANLMELIYYKIQCLMIVDIYKMYFKEINIKNRVYSYYFDYLIKTKNRNKNILIR